MAKRILHDEYFRKAKQEGYVARSAYKLLQIQQAKSVIRKGDRVLDLGCAPGAWLQVSSPLVGPRGRVIGLDLQDVRHPMPDNVRTFVGDVFEYPPEDLVEAAGRGFGTVLSDMAPKTTGFNEHELSVRLCDRILETLPTLLRHNGVLVMKVFEGAEYPGLLKRCQRHFGKVKGFKPKASRDVSREMYVIAHYYRHPDRRDDDTPKPRDADA
ncbi:RlmE family RNA methyltransferase [Pyruvatibacter sp.]|uniref:RlmE family RNA methyltransferase n=1 Tax=Pyruvatibacter sp. TaxID=1981328 RepID=UPI0032EE2841